MTLEENAEMFSKGFIDQEGHETEMLGGVAKSSSTDFYVD